jgi:hypothetical protein
MTIRIEDDVVRIEGAAQVADAEPLLSALLDDPTRSVDLTASTRVHSAIIQILVALRPRIIGAPADRFQNGYIAALLDAGKR